MCGLIGVSGTSDAAKDVFLGLMNLQHRGQDGAGILTLGGNGAGSFNLQKGSGLVENIFSERTFKGLRGQVAIGHTRYATIGRKDPNLLQPFLDYRAGIGLGHNGNIVNVYALRRELVDKGLPLPATESDSEMILRLIANHLLEQAPRNNGVHESTGASSEKLNPESLFSAIEHCMSKAVGAYSVVGLDATGSLFGFRDPCGIRPLVLGKRVDQDGKTSYGMASETIALRYLGYNDAQEIGPGEAVVIDSAGTVHRRLLKKTSYSPCMFEWVYFARVESDIGGIPVYEARFKLGLLLAQRLKDLNIEADVVVPVPETSRAAAIAIAEALELPFRELLIKNRYVQRTFILDGQEARQEAIRRKLFPIASEVAGKRVLVVDDSIVRGNTGSQIIELLRHSGAKEVILVSTCPPIKDACFYGIDFPSRTELVACDSTYAEIAAKLGADRVVFQTLDGLRSALQQESLCTGCLTGEYPTDVSQAQDFEARRIQDRQKPLKGARGVSG